MHHSSTHIYKNCAAPLFLNKCTYIMYTHTHTYILQEVFCTTHAIYEPNSIASFLGISGFHSCYHLLFIKKIVLYAVQFIVLYCFYEWDRLRILWTSKYTWDLSENWYRRKTYNSTSLEWMSSLSYCCKREHEKQELSGVFLMDWVPLFMLFSFWFYWSM